MIAGDGVAITLVEIGVGVAEVEREHTPGDAESDVPGGVAHIGNAVREGRAAAEATRNDDLGAIERIARPKIPMADLTRDIEVEAVRQKIARRRDLHGAVHVRAGGARAHDRRRVVTASAEREL